MDNRYCLTVIIRSNVRAVQIQFIDLINSKIFLQYLRQNNSIELISKLWNLCWIELMLIWKGLWNEMKVSMDFISFHQLSLNEQLSYVSLYLGSNETFKGDQCLWSICHTYVKGDSLINSITIDVLISIRGTVLMTSAHTPPL